MSNNNEDSNDTIGRQNQGGRPAFLVTSTPLPKPPGSAINAALAGLFSGVKPSTNSTPSLAAPLASSNKERVIPGRHGVRGSSTAVQEQMQKQARYSIKHSAPRETSSFKASSSNVLARLFTERRCSSPTRPKPLDQLLCTPGPHDQQQQPGLFIRKKPGYAWDPDGNTKRTLEHLFATPSHEVHRKRPSVDCPSSRGEARSMPSRQHTAQDKVQTAAKQELAHLLGHKSSTPIQSRSSGSFNEATARVAAPADEVIANSQASGDDEDEWNSKTVAQNLTAQREKRNKLRDPHVVVEMAADRSSHETQTEKSVLQDQGCEDDREFAMGPCDQRGGADRAHRHHIPAPQSLQAGKSGQDMHSTKQPDLHVAIASGLKAQRNFIARLPTISSEPDTGKAAASRVLQGSGLAPALHRAQASLRCARAEWERCRRPGRNEPVTFVVMSTEVEGTLTKCYTKICATKRPSKEFPGTAAGSVDSILSANQPMYLLLPPHVIKDMPVRKGIRLVVEPPWTILSTPSSWQGPQIMICHYARTEAHAHAV